MNFILIDATIHIVEILGEVPNSDKLAVLSFADDKIYIQPKEDVKEDMDELKTVAKRRIVDIDTNIEDYEIQIKGLQSIIAKLRAKRKALEIFNETT